MDSFKPLFDAPYESDYLHYQSEKFWEIRVYNTSKTFIRCGRLRSNAQEDTSTIQTVEKTYSTLDDAKQAAKRLIAIKISKGYQYLQEKQPAYAPARPFTFETIIETEVDESLKRPAPTDIFNEDLIIKQVKLDPVRKSSTSSGTEKMEEEKISAFEEETPCAIRPLEEYKIHLSDSNPVNKAKIFRKILEMGMDCAFEAKSIVLRGQQEELEVLKAFVKQLESEEGNNVNGPTTIKINPKLSRQSSDIEKYGLSLGLICEVGNEDIVVLGNEDQVEAFKAYLIVKEEEVAASVSVPQTDNNGMNGGEEEEFVQHEVDLSYNSSNDKLLIEQVVSQSGLIYEYRDPTLLLLGSKTGLRSLLGSLINVVRGNGGHTTNIEEIFQKVGGSLGGTVKPVKEKVKEIKSYLTARENTVQYHSPVIRNPIVNSIEEEIVQHEVDLFPNNINVKVNILSTLQYYPQLTYEYRDPKIMLKGPREEAIRAVEYMIVYITSANGYIAKLEESLKKLKDDAATAAKKKAKNLQNQATTKTQNTGSSFLIQNNIVQTNPIHKKDLNIDQIIYLTTNHLDHRAAIENILIQNNLYYELDGSQLYILGPQTSINTITDYLNALETGNAPQGPSPYAPQPGTKAVKLPYPIDKPEKNEYRVNDIDPLLMADIQQKGQKMDIVATYARNSVTIFPRPGFKVNSKFLEYIDSKKLKFRYDLLLSQNRASIETNAKYCELTSNFEYKKIPLEPTYKGQLANIKSRANELMLVCDAEKTQLVVAGARKNIVQFQKYLQSLKGGNKNTMHPKYWDSFEERPFVKIELDKGTPEYEEIVQQFFTGVKMKINITGISRIQNAPLMEQHIENITTRMQKKLLQDPAHRKMLFERVTDRHVDPTYAKHETPNCSVSEGVYLNELAIRIIEDNMEVKGPQKIYLSDVYTGVSVFDKGDGAPLPFGCDSVLKENDYYVVYDRLQSYPLYEIDYQIETEDECKGQNEDGGESDRTDELC